MLVKKNTLFFFLFSLLVGLSLYLFSRDSFLGFASDNKLIAGFIKFFVLATLGDLLSSYLKNKTVKLPTYFLLRALIWGLIGVTITLMFPVYSTGVSYLFDEGLLPFKNAFMIALFTSIFMNATFGPMMMLGHFTSDGYLDAKSKGISFSKTIHTLDYVSFMRRTFFKVIPLFWIPAHTITFLLPREYQVLFAATLGIALGFILGVTKRMSQNGND